MRALAAALLMTLASAPSLAADGAALNVIGYSEDSRYFAFEEYGVQDGSGFPYWNVYVLDLVKDSWVDGAPVRVLVEDEQGKLSAAKAKARASADPLLLKSGIAEPAEILAANPATEVSADRSRLAFDRWYVSGGASPDQTNSVLVRHELTVENVTLPDPKDCYPDDGPYVGLKLSLTDKKFGSTRIIHGDKNIPSSRGCPSSYDVSAVVAPAGFTNEDRLVAIIGVYARGFEGLNHRFIAVPFVLSD
jgi:predicted secreted protein